MSWTETDRLDADGASFAIFSEHIRGERRFYWAQMQLAEDKDTGRWLDVPFEGAYDKRTVKRRVERHVREGRYLDRTLQPSREEALE